MSLLKFTVIFVILLLLNGSDARTAKKNTKHTKQNEKTTTAAPEISNGSLENGSIEQNDTLDIAELGRSYGSIEQYTEDRKSILFHEEAAGVGSDIYLSADEIEADKVLMLAKADELGEGFSSPRKFPPAQHVFDVLEKIQNSKLFRIISAMPKGALLHTHSSAMGNTDFLIQLTKRDNLWACNGPWKGLNIIGFQFSKNMPQTVLKENCNWRKMSDLRYENGIDWVEKYLREHFSLYPKTNYADNDGAWRDFEAIFGRLSGLLDFAPVRKDYFRNALEWLLNDGVQYVEIRTGLSVLYDLEGKNIEAEDTVRMYQETVNEFKKENPHFLGCKLIISPYRGKQDNQLDEYIKTFYKIKAKFPGFIAGFDLVGQEERGRPLKDMAPRLLQMQQKGVQFFFHAGETNWYGTKVDENLVDAVLLGTKRIGHGYAVTKHPVVMKMLKEKHIAVEVNPISNQVLRLVGDLRNHPAAHLFANNYPVVICSDDPSFWKTTPLSHDFYMAFLGIASGRANLKFLKKLAMNSFEYSAMSAKEKEEAQLWWTTKWLEFITYLKNLH